MIEELLEEILTKDYQKPIAKSWYLQPLKDVENVCYRQEIFEDLVNNQKLLESLRDFTEKMEDVRRILRMTKELGYEVNKKGWFLEAGFLYCSTIEKLSIFLRHVEINSSGLVNFRNYLNRYVSSVRYTALKSDCELVRNIIRDVKYVLILQPGQVTVKEYENEEEYANAIEKTFQKFKEEECIEKYRFNLQKATGMNHIEARIVEFLKTIQPKVFQLLDEFFEKHETFLDETLDSISRELTFYTSYLDFVNRLGASGLPFTIPKVSEKDKEELIINTFDPILAAKSGGHVVQNDVILKPGERIMVITGPNQGGKTTYARLYGLLHYLAGLGLPVPGSEAKLFLPDGIYTHFERQEKVESQKSKLEDDLIRLKTILGKATQNSLLVFNEIFSSTASYDATLLGKELIAKLSNLDCLVAWVTFIDELSNSENGKVVSLVALVSPEDPSIRTFKIERRKAEGKAHAFSIARKYGLTYEEIKRRLSNESPVA